MQLSEQDGFRKCEFTKILQIKNFDEQEICSGPPLKIRSPLKYQVPPKILLFSRSPLLKSHEKFLGPPLNKGGADTMKLLGTNNAGEVNFYKKNENLFIFYLLFFPFCHALCHFESFLPFESFFFHFQNKKFLFFGGSCHFKQLAKKLENRGRNKKKIELSSGGKISTFDPNIYS